MNSINFLLQRSLSFKTFGNSMIPLLYDQDVVFITKIKFPAVQVNDIITVKKNAKLITHRVIYKSLKYLILKGDNNNSSDGKFYPKQIVGRVDKVKRNTQLFNPANLYLFQSSIYFQEIVKIKKAFTAENVNFIFLKGLPLHLFYEKKYPQRMYADCDLLISKDDCEKINKILNRMGYTADIGISKKYFQPFLNSETKGKQYVKTIKDIPINIDIHYIIPLSTHSVKLPLTLFDQYEQRVTQDFLMSKRRVTINDEKFPILNLDFLVLYLLFHFYEHRWTEIHRLEFIAQILKKQTVGWKHILTYAKQQKILNFIIPGLYLLKKYYSISKPFTNAKRLYSTNVTYSLSVLKHIYNERVLFDSVSNPFGRLQKVILLFLLFDISAVKKVTAMLHPRLILHLVYFVTAVGIFYAKKYIYKEKQDKITFNAQKY